MVLELTFKTPDVLEQFDSVECSSTQDKAIEIAKRFIKHGEYVTLLVDTISETVTVKENR
jgi:protoheme ferro-lyase